MKMVRYAKIGSIISGIILIICGLFLTIFPSFSIIAISRVIGALIILSGIVKIIGYFSNDLYSLAFQFGLALGIFSIILGTVLIIYPKWLASVLPIIIGLVILINSLFTFQTSMDSKKFGLDYWWVSLILSILTSVLGITIIFNPFSSAAVMMAIIGITTMFFGAEKVFVSLYTVVVKKKNKEKEKYIDVTEYNFEEKRDQN